jgi:hypothetical protein
MLDRRVDGRHISRTSENSSLLAMTLLKRKS